MMFNARGMSQFHCATGFGGAAMADRFTARDKQRAAAREVAQRKRVYPRLIEAGKMKQSDADLQIAIMSEIEATNAENPAPSMISAPPGSRQINRSLRPSTTPASAERELRPSASAGGLRPVRWLPLSCGQYRFRTP
ncbi:hypothetical protein FQV39_27820 [Bosea sp. F3-2]|nr:hypothetical protein FQV39_27820 [Bosea sp. F3-2]